jgi:hypothetical protein
MAERSEGSHDARIVCMTMGGGGVTAMLREQGGRLR